MAPRPSCLAQRRAAAIRERNRRVVAHRHLVEPLASHYAHHSQEPIEDLTQAGLLGLIRAAELYNSEKGIPFEAFARPHVRGAILHHLRDVAPMVRLPRRQAELHDRLSRLEKTQEATLSTECQVSDNTPQPLREALGVDETTWRDLLVWRGLRRTMSCEGGWLDALPAPSAADATDVESQSTLEAMLTLLEPRQRHVVRQVVLEGASYRQLGRQLEMSPMTVQRLLHRGLERLRQEIQAGLLTQPRQPRQGVCRAASAAPAC
ncbi:MAG: sigma-70 family RNA polymerase sigma factor [Synechococcaceae cyanobacterium]|nr:sigma-70 family RNA polymerase sigma factor [Synechococcaceae cyanobacterium]